jgi:hypothetical protein
MTTNLAQVPPIGNRDPVDALSTTQYDSLLNSLAGKPTRRRSRGVLPLSAADVLGEVADRLHLYADCVEVAA